jgi:hypothetical protein
MAVVHDRVGRPWWAKVEGAVGSSTVVVANVFGEFGSQGADEPFGETVRPRTPRGNPDHVDAHIGQDSVE